MKTVTTSENNRASSASKQALSPSIKELFVQRMKAKCEPLTPSKLRASSGLENLSDEDAAEAIDSINKLVGLLFQAVTINETNVIDNQHVVYLHPQSKAA